MWALIKEYRNILTNVQEAFPIFDPYAVLRRGLCVVRTGLEPVWTIVDVSWHSLQGHVLWFSSTLLECVTYQMFTQLVYRNLFPHSILTALSLTSTIPPPDYVTYIDLVIFVQLGTLRICQSTIKPRSQDRIRTCKFIKWCSIPWCYMLFIEIHTIGL